MPDTSERRNRDEAPGVSLVMTPSATIEPEVHQRPRHPRTRWWLLGLAVAATLSLLGAWQGREGEVRLVAVDAAGGRVRWSTVLGPDRAGASTPSVAAGRVVVAVNVAADAAADRMRKLAAFDVTNGRPLWETDLTYAPVPSDAPDRESRAPRGNGVTPTASATNVYVNDGSDDALSRSRGLTLLALDAPTGRVRWVTSSVEGPFSGDAPALAMVGERVVVPVEESGHLTLRGLDAASGVGLWQADLGDERLTRPTGGPAIVADERAVFVGTSAAIHALDTEGGAVRFRVAEPGQELRLEGSTLYRLDQARTTIAALDPASGARRWSYTLSFGGRASYLATFAADREAVYAACACSEGTDRESRLIAVDTHDGRERWQVALGRSFGEYPVPVAVGEGLVFVADDEAVALETATGRERWRVVGGRNMATDGGRTVLTVRAPRWRHWMASLHLPWR